LHVTPTGSIGLGTASPNAVGNATIPGQALNLVSASNRATVAIQGNQGAYLTMVNGSGSANHRVLQLKQINGFAELDVLYDNMTNVSVPNVMSIHMGEGSVGFGIAAVSAKPLLMKSGAYVTTGGVWTNASSREFKQDIEPLTIEQARETVLALNPVGFRYKKEPDEQYLGFIAEDVPELVAMNDRKSLAPMDITAVLTKVVQDQDRRIEQQTQIIDKQSKLLEELTNEMRELRQLIAEKDSTTN
jgi:hypothetical protein